MNKSSCSLASQAKSSDSTRRKEDTEEEDVQDEMDMKTKLKHLKEMYYKCKRNNAVSGHDRLTFAHYDAMEALLGDRPSVEAICNSGIDSSLTGENTEIIQLSAEEAQSVASDIADVKIEEIKLTSEPDKKKKSGGRLTTARRAEQLSETCTKKQSDMFSGLLTMQNKSFEDMMQRQISEQGKWEGEMMEREHENQMRQMSTLMDGFLRGMQMINSTQNLQCPPMYYPTPPAQFSGQFSYPQPASSPTLSRPPPSPSPSSTSGSHSSQAPSPGLVSCPSFSPSSFPLSLPVRIPPTPSPSPHYSQTPTPPAANEHTSESPHPSIP